MGDDQQIRRQLCGVVQGELELCAGVSDGGEGAAERDVHVLPVRGGEALRGAGAEHADPGVVARARRVT